MATNTPICVKTDCSNEEVCWTCGDKATNKEWRESLDKFEWTCDKCHKEEYKSCSHKYECGCGKQSCLEMGLEKCEEDFCDNESCRHYYDHRNDNCDCGMCGYCDSDLEEEEEVCGKWTEDKDELTDQDTGELCWCCENCGAYPNWGVDCE